MYPGNEVIGWIDFPRMTFVCILRCIYIRITFATRTQCTDCWCTKITARHGKCTYMHVVMNCVRFTKQMCIWTEDYYIIIYVYCTLRCTWTIDTHINILHFRIDFCCHVLDVTHRMSVHWLPMAMKRKKKFGVELAARLPSPDDNNEIVHISIVDKMTEISGTRRSSREGQPK